MIQKRYAVPALVLGLTLVGGATASAFAPNLSLETLSSFTADEQAAIQKAFTIRQTAEKEADAVLTQAGVTKEELHTAFKAGHEKQREVINAALDANDYNAFVAAAKAGPQGEKVTAEVFAKLVEIRKLEKAGDREGAMELRKTLQADGFMGPMGPRGGGMGERGPR